MKFIISQIRYFCGLCMKNVRSERSENDQFDPLTSTSSRNHFITLESFLPCGQSLKFMTFYFFEMIGYLEVSEISVQQTDQYDSSSRLFDLLDALIAMNFMRYNPIIEVSIVCESFRNSKQQNNVMNVKLWPHAIYGVVSRRLQGHEIIVLNLSIIF